MQNSVIHTDRRGDAMLREMRGSWRAVERGSIYERPSGGNKSAV